jgi:serine/threonine protein kinase
MPLTPSQVLLGKYRIEKLLGSGAWGDVYLAEDLALGRHVAIKHLKTDWAGDKTILQRFLQEARVIAALKHPNVVVIHALEQDDNEHYIVQEYAERGTVSDLLEEQTRLPIEHALDIAVAVCRALEAVHPRGIIHRDIKPSNILLFESPERELIPKLCDFGIAHVPSRKEQRPLTEEGALVGTVDYMSPEQVQGRKIDERADIYSLGAVLYKLLTGRTVFAGNRWDILQAHVGKEPPSPTLDRPEISSALNDLILRALSKDPADRHQKVRQMRRALEQINRQEREKREKAASLYAQGLTHLQASEWQPAIQLLSDVAILVPGFEEVEDLLEKAQLQEKLERLYELGLAHIQSGSWGEAIETLEKVHQLDEGHRDVADQLAQARTQQKLETLYTEGTSAAQLQDWATAVEVFSQILQIDEDYQDAAAQLDKTEEQQELAELYDEGVTNLRKEEWFKARQCFQAIIDMDPIYRDADDRLQEIGRQERLNILYRQGIRFAEQNDWRQAIAKFESVLQLDEDYKDVSSHLRAAQEQENLKKHYDQGMEHFNRGEWPQAVQQFQNIIDIDPEYRNAAAKLDEARRQQQLWQLYHQGVQFMKKEEWQEAIPTFEQVIVLNEHYRDVRAKLEEAHHRMNLDTSYASALRHQEKVEWEKAADLYLQILKQEPSYKDAAQRLAEVNLQRKLLGLYRQACNLVAVENWSAATAKLREIQANYRDASQLLKKVEEQEHLLALYCQAEDNLAQENWSAAIVALEEVLAIDKDYLEAAKRLKKASYRQAIHLHQQEQLEEAIQCFERAGEYEDAKERLTKAQEQKACHDLFETAKGHCDKKEWSETQKAVKRLRESDSCQTLAKKHEEELTLLEIYSRGMEHFDRREWLKAIAALRLVKEIDSEYRDLDSVLKKAQDSNLLRRNYTVLEEIDTTGTTRVHKARDHNGDLVAIKMLAPSYVVAQEPRPLIEALRKGAELTQRLDHSCIVKVRSYEIRGRDEAGGYEDVHIVVMDYVEGENLRAILNKRKKLRVGEALLVAEQVCEALVHAHSRGVFHGDLKPSNILLTQGRQVKITDFANAPYGTPSFRPPEQARRGTKAIGPHTDVYALGQTICKLITGNAPFKAGEAKSPLPKNLERLVEKATQSEPEKRYKTAQDMLADIRRVKQSLWHRRLAEWLDKLVENLDRVPDRWKIFAVAGPILLTILGAVLEPLVEDWIQARRDAQTATPTIITETPTPTVTPIITLDPDLALISPKEGTSFEKGENVKLQWAWKRDLADNEFFMVKIRPKGQQEFDLMDLTKLSYQFVSASELTQSGTYEWQVAIVSPSGEEKGASHIWTFEVQ